MHLIWDTEHKKAIPTSTIVEVKVNEIKTNGMFLSVVIVVQTLLLIMETLKKNV